ncbi:MAG: HD domain-containing protein [Defluviitaleaceae bacterium]|nr:HD domain-containing protein [Defluviitaleaceae bacterium]
MIFIEDFADGERIIAHYLCKKKESLKTKAGKSYISMVLADKTGTIDAKVWNINHDIQNFEAGDFIKIEAEIITYQDELQLRVLKIRRSVSGEYSPENYIPATDKDVDGLLRQISALISSIEDEYIRALVESIFAQPEIAAAFPTHTAAKYMHHSYLGGLCEHILSVAQICDFLAPRYKFVNRDLLIAGALLHDIGKIHELSSLPENDYTDDGQLIGHIVITAQMIGVHAAKIPGFPKQLESLIVHSVVSHHGKHEWGSPKLPKTIEACILHCADNMDANIKMFEEALEKSEKSTNQGEWVGYNRVLARNIRKSNF